MEDPRLARFSRRLVDEEVAIYTIRGVRSEMDLSDRCWQ